MTVLPFTRLEGVNPLELTLVKDRLLHNMVFLVRSWLALSLKWAELQLQQGGLDVRIAVYEAQCR